MTSFSYHQLSNHGGNLKKKSYDDEPLHLQGCTAQCALCKVREPCNSTERGAQFTILVDLIPPAWVYGAIVQKCATQKVAHNSQDILLWSMELMLRSCFLPHLSIFRGTNLSKLSSQRKNDVSVAFAWFAKDFWACISHNEAAEFYKMSKILLKMWFYKKECSRKITIG